MADPLSARSDKPSPKACPLKDGHGKSPNGSGVICPACGFDPWKRAMTHPSREDYEVRVNHQDDQLIDLLLAVVTVLVLAGLAVGGLVALL